MSGRLKICLLSGATADVAGDAKEWNGIGEGTLHIEGTWDGATVTISGSVGGTAFTNVANGAFKENTITPFEAGEVFVKATLSGAGALTDLSAYIMPQSVFQAGVVT